MVVGKRMNPDDVDRAGRGLLPPPETVLTRMGLEARAPGDARGDWKPIRDGDQLRRDGEGGTL